MRLLGLALFTLLVMGLIQFALWTDRDTTSRALGPLAQADRVLHDFASDVERRDARPGDRHHVIALRQEDTWGALSGSPGYHRARFNLPREARVEAGTLTLDLTAQLQQDGVARLKININGQRRGELVLPAGKSEHRVTLNLLPADLTQSVVEVTLAANGRFPTAVCTARWSGGMVLRVEPTSHLNITTEAPLTSLGDRMRVSGDPARVVWGAGLEPETMARMLRFAMNEAALGTQVGFVAPQGGRDGAVVLSSNDLDIADEHVAATAAPVLDQWPMQPSAGSPLWDAKFFEYRTNWRIPYDLRSTPDGTLPTHFDFEMSLVGLDQADRWMLSVVLNGRAIHTERLSENVTRIARSVALPAEYHGFANVLELRVMNDEPRSGVTCLSGTPVMAQLEAGTRLRGGALSGDADVAAFGAALPGDLSLVVASAFNAAEATSAVQFLSEAFGPATRWTLAATDDRYTPGTVQLILRTTLGQAVAQARAAGAHDLWVLWPRLGNEMDAPYALVRITSETDLAPHIRADGGRVAALVSLPPAAQTAKPAQTAYTTPKVMVATQVARPEAPSAGLAPRVPSGFAGVSERTGRPMRPALVAFGPEIDLETTANTRPPRTLKPGNRPIPRPRLLAVTTAKAGPDVIPMPDPERVHLIWPVQGPIHPNGPAFMATATTPRAKPVVN